MEDRFNDFYDTLLDNLDSYSGEYASFIDCGPNLFKLLCNLLDHDINKELRSDICSAIAYYVVPMDIIPEQVYGPYGYIDDIYLSVFVLKRVAKEYDYDFLQLVWNNPDINIKDVMDECYERSLEVLEEEDINAILEYIGLK